MAPRNGQLHYMTGKELQDTPRKLFHFEKAALYDPLNPDAHINHGVALAMLGKPEEALKVCRRVLSTLTCRATVVPESARCIQHGSEPAHVGGAHLPQCWDGAADPWPLDRGRVRLQGMPAVRAAEPATITHARSIDPRMDGCQEQLARLATAT